MIEEETLGMGRITEEMNHREKGRIITNERKRCTVPRRRVVNTGNERVVLSGLNQ